MARSHFVKKAQKNIYRVGKHISYESKRGKRKGQQKSKLDKTIPSGKDDTILIAKGESYYWWAFKNGGKHFSKTAPKASQLTQSEYLSTLYGIQEGMEAMSASDFESPEDLSSAVEDITSQLEELRDAQEEKKSNMPDSLQESPTGELLQERYDNLDNVISEIEGIGFDDYEEPDEDEIRDELADDVDYTPTEDEDEEFDLHEKKKTLVTEEMIDEKRKEHLEEWIDEKLQELQNVSFE